MIGLKRGTVRLVPFRKEWRLLFASEQKRLQQKLGSCFIAIEHIGSTAIPGMQAKPIIDILAGIRDQKNVKKIRKMLCELGYVERPQPNAQEFHLLFVKGPESKRTHYLHVMQWSGPVWKNDLLFRNYLRTHQRRAKEYATLKMRLARQFPKNRQEYTRRKAQFIIATLRLAKSYSRKPITTMVHKRRAP